MTTLSKRIVPERIRNLSQISSIPPHIRAKYIKWQLPLLLLILLAIWFLSPGWLHSIDATAGMVDQSIWLLIILSIICFLIIASLCWWLLQQYWLVAGLPSMSFMVSQYKYLSLWQQFVFYWASFALLLLAALVCLSAIC